MAESYGKGEGAGEGCASSSAQSAGAIYSQEAINYLFQTKIGKEDVIQMREKKKKKWACSEKTIQVAYAIGVYGRSYTAYQGQNVFF